MPVERILNADFQKLLTETSIIDGQVIEKIDKVIDSKEVAVFKTDYQEEVTLQPKEE